MKINWRKRKGEILRIVLEEIASRGVKGYVTRSVERLADELGIRTTYNALQRGLPRHIPDWDSLRGDAESKFSTTDGTISVTIESAPEPLPGDHPQIVELRRQIDTLKAEQRSARAEMKRLRQHESTTSELVGVIQNEMAPIELGPGIDSGPPPSASAQRSADMVLLLSDEHADHVISPEVTLGLEHYDFNVFRARMSRLRDVIRAFSSVHLPTYRFERLWILSLGDKIQGSIHDMKLRNHFANDIRAALATADAEAEMIASLVPYFDFINYIGVSGNHARTTKMPQHEDPHDDFDFLISAGIAQRLSRYIDDGRVTVTLPKAWTAFARIRGWNWCMSHGDGVKGYAGFPWYGFERREGRQRALFGVTNPGEIIDAFCYGHFHTNTSRTNANSKAFHNGAFFYTDPYAVNSLAVGSAPEQRLFVVEDKESFRGPILDIPVYLRDPEAEDRLHSGEWEPDIGRRTVLDTVSPEINK